MGGSGDALPNVATPYFKHLEVLALNDLGERMLALKSCSLILGWNARCECLPRRDSVT